MAKKSEGLGENVAGLLCYLVGWITGVIFLIIDKRKFVRFHAWQSILVFGILTGVNLVLRGISQALLTAAAANPFSFGVTMAAGGGLLLMFLWFLNTIIGFISLVLWILLMYKAYKGEKYKLPLVGNLAEKYA